MKNKIIAIILSFALICSSSFLLANAYNFKLGDINEDGEVTASDARLVLRASAELEPLSEEKLIVADVNFDNEITASDARVILRASAELEPLPEMPTQNIPSETEPSTEPDSETTTEPDSEITTDEPITDIIAEEYPAAIDAFFSGNFYLDATMGTGDDTSSLKMAISEKGFEFSASVELVEGLGNMELSLMQLAKTIYIKYPDANGKRKYFALDEETMKKANEVFGIDISEIFTSDVFQELNFSSIVSTSKPVYTTGEYNGEGCDIYTFQIEDSKMAFYTIGEDVKRITTIDSEGNEDTLMEVNELTKRIPGKMLSTQGCQEAELLEFVADLMALMPEEA